MTPAVYGVRGVGGTTSYARAVSGAAPAAATAGVLFMARKVPGAPISLGGFLPNIEFQLDASGNLLVISDAVTVTIPLGAYLDTWVLAAASITGGVISVYLNGVAFDTDVVTPIAPTQFILSQNATADVVCGGGFYGLANLSQSNHELIAQELFASGSLYAAAVLLQHVYAADMSQRPASSSWADIGTLANAALTRTGTTQGLVTPGDFMVPGDGGGSGPSGPPTVETVAAATYTIVAADANKIKRFTNVAGCAIELPAAAGNIFVTLDIVEGAGPCTLTPDGTTINGDAVGPIALANAPTGISIIPTGTDTVFDAVGGISNGSLADVVLITFVPEIANVSVAGAVTIDWNDGQKQKLTLSENITAITITDPPGPGNFMLRVIQDASRTVTGWPAKVKWPGGAAPTITTGAGAIDAIAFYFDGTDYYGTVTPDFS